MESKKSATLAQLALANGVWFTCTQWTATLMSFIYWDISPPMTVWNIGCVQTLAALANALGAVVCGQHMDISGSKSVFIASTVATALYYAGLSQVRTFGALLAVQALRCGYHFDAGAEMYLATVTSEKHRSQALALTMNVPQAIAYVAGPMLAARTAVLFGLRYSELVCAGELCALG